MAASLRMSDPILSEIDSHWSRQVTCATLDRNWPAALRNFTDGDFLISDGHGQISVRKKVVAKIFFPNFSPNLTILSRFIIITCRKNATSDFLCDKWPLYWYGTRQLPCGKGGRTDGWTDGRMDGGQNTRAPHTISFLFVPREEAKNCRLQIC